MQLTYLEAIRQGIWEEMDRDPSVAASTKLTDTPLSDARSEQ